MAKLRLYHLLSAVIAICLFQTVASASVSIYILSPSNGQTVVAGQTVSVQVQVQCNNNFLNTVRIAVNGSVIYNQNYGAWSTQDFVLANSSFTVPATPAAFYLVEVEATQNGGDPNAYTSFVMLNGAADTTAPSYSGTAGVKSVERIDGVSATVDWYQATDAVTTSANMKYEVYYDAAQANVFTAGVKKTVTGSLTTTITGLNATATYYVGVRAVDAAGNRESNTRTIVLGLPLNAVRPGAWAMYE